MTLGTMDLVFGSNGVGIHGVAGILIFNPGSDLDCNATGCNYVLAFETRALHLRPDILPLGHAIFTTKAKSVVFGTSAKFAFQRIGHMGHSL